MKKLALALMVAGSLGAAAAVQAAGFFTNGVCNGGTASAPCYVTPVPSGIETMPADTQLPNGQPPQSYALTTSQLNLGTIQTEGATFSFLEGVPSRVAGGEKMTLVLTGAISSATNIQLPTAVNMIAALPTGAPVGYTYTLKLVNRGGTGSGVWTVTTNTGDTLTGNMTVPVAGSRLLRVQYSVNSTILVDDLGN